MNCSVREDLLSEISDAHKDAYGFRPRGEYNHLPIPALEEELKRIYVAVEYAIKEEKLYRAAAAEAFEASIAKAISVGAYDRLTALRWLFEADESIDEGHYNLETGYIDGWVNYNFGLCYRYDIINGVQK